MAALSSASALPSEAYICLDWHRFAEQKLGSWKPDRSSSISTPAVPGCLLEGCLEARVQCGSSPAQRLGSAAQAPRLQQACCHSAREGTLQLWELPLWHSHMRLAQVEHIGSSSFGNSP